MKKLLLGSAAIMTAASASAEHTVNVAILLGLTGPAESLAPAMVAAAESAVAEVNAAGGVMGHSFAGIVADSTCVDADAATAAAERLVTSDGVAAIVGALCSGATGAVLANVAVPNGVLMISPSATSPALSTAEDNGLFFRTSPSDARQGAVLAEETMSRGFTDVAVTYTNNDYGVGLADAFVESFTALGGNVSISLPHEDGKADYNAEVSSLGATGSEAVAVFGYLDGGGRGITEGVIDGDVFEQIIFGEAMWGDSIMAALGADLDGVFGLLPGTEESPKDPYAGEAYDAAALTLLSMAAAGSVSDSAAAASKVFDVANAPGQKIEAGDLATALKVLAEGGDIDYVGMTNVELVGPGEAAGAYMLQEVVDGEITVLAQL
ncbi:MAG: ABC transporter substrate-binding protein [Alphaproteobacteria bacterium]